MGDFLTVKLHVYDLSRGMARSMSLPIVGKQIDGIWHTGVEVFGSEWFYSGGGPQGATHAQFVTQGQMQPDRTIVLGRTDKSLQELRAQLEVWRRAEFAPARYRLCVGGSWCLRSCCIWC